MWIGHSPGVVFCPTFQVQLQRPSPPAVVGSSPRASLAPELYLTSIEQLAPAAVSIITVGILFLGAGEVTETRFNSKSGAGGGTGVAGGASGDTVGGGKGVSAGGMASPDHSVTVAAGSGVEVSVGGGIGVSVGRGSVDSASAGGAGVSPTGRPVGVSVGSRSICAGRLWPQASITSASAQPIKSFPFFMCGPFYK